MRTKQPSRMDVDTRIDACLRTDPQAAGIDPDQQVIQQLDQYYQLPREQTLILKRVQARLEHAQNLRAEEMPEQSASPLPLRAGQMRGSTLRAPHLEARRRHLRRFSLLAAVALIVLLFSSALVALRQERPSTGTPVHVKTPSPLPQGQPARLYTLDDKLAANERFLSQVDPFSGQVYWQFPIKDEDNPGGGGSSCMSTPIQVDNLLYFEGSDSRGTTLYALNATTGVQRWKMLIGGNCENPVLAGGLILLAQSSLGHDRVEAFDALTGNLSWRQDYSGSGTSFIDNFEIIGASQGVLYLDNLLLAQRKTQISALDVTTGTQIWQKEFPGIAVITKTAIINHALYLAGEPDLEYTGQTPGTLVAFDLSTNTQLWSKILAGPVYELGGDAQRIYLVTAGKDSHGAMGAGSVYVLQTSNGQVVWQQHPDQQIAGMLVLNGQMYLALAEPGGVISSQGYKDKNGKYRVKVNGPAWHLEALNADNGQLAWQQTMGAGVDTPSFIYHSNLYLVDIVNGTIDLLDGSTGRQVKALPIPGYGDKWMMAIGMYLV